MINKLNNHQFEDYHLLSKFRLHLFIKSFVGIVLYFFPHLCISQPNINHVWLIVLRKFELFKFGSFNFWQFLAKNTLK